jgi:hypothetical protein
MFSRTPSKVAISLMRDEAFETAAEKVKKTQARTIDQMYPFAVRI